MALAQKVLHTVNDASAMLSISRAKLYQEVAAGRIALVHIGGKALVPQTAIEKYIQFLLDRSKIEHHDRSRPRRGAAGNAAACTPAAKAKRLATRAANRAARNGKSQ